MAEDIKEWIRLVADGTPQARERAAIELRRQGEAVVPALIEAVEDKLKKSRRLIFSHSPLLQVAALLAEFEDTRSLWSLLLVSYQTSSFQEGGIPLRKVLSALEKRASPEDIQALIDVLARALIQHFILLKDIISVVETLIHIAERDPKPELRAVIPLLNYTITNPLTFAFIGHRRRLKAIFVNEALPIPATTAQTTRDLPIPTDQDSQNDR